MRKAEARPLLPRGLHMAAAVVPWLLAIGPASWADFPLPTARSYFMGVNQSALYMLLVFSDTWTRKGTIADIFLKICEDVCYQTRACSSLCSLCRP